MKTEKFHLKCDRADQRAIDIKGTPNVGVEHLGSCHGTAALADGTVIGSHNSSTMDFLRMDLRAYCRRYAAENGITEFEIIDHTIDRTYEVKNEK